LLAEGSPAGGKTISAAAGCMVGWTSLMDKSLCRFAERARPLLTVRPRKILFHGLHLALKWCFNFLERFPHTVIPSRSFTGSTKGNREESCSGSPNPDRSRPLALFQPSWQRRTRLGLKLPTRLPPWQRPCLKRRVQPSPQRKFQPRCRPRVKPRLKFRVRFRLKIRLRARLPLRSPALPSIRPRRLRPLCRGPLRLPPLRHHLKRWETRL
jgi:hypothetical protein